MKRYMLMALCLMSACLSGQAQSETPTNDDPLAGKIINVIGDSYVKNHRRPIEESWHYKVAQKHHMKYNNYGRNGRCIVFDRTAEKWGKPMLETYKEMTDTADYVLVIGGHNDAEKTHCNVDSLQMFREGMEAFCDSLIHKYPRARIGFVTPWNVPRPGFKEVIAIIKEVCGSRSIPVLDAAHEGGIFVWDPAFRHYYFQSDKDTAHLNARGHDRFLTRGEAFLLTL